ncbi:hypothetical protein EJB05_52788, partial [Eragrostis curvula]
LLLRYSTRKQQSQQPGLLHLPPSHPALPILGHLHLVGPLPHVSLWSLAQKHGTDFMLLRLGAMSALLVTSPRAAETVLRTHDHVLASRPHSLATDHPMVKNKNVVGTVHFDLISDPTEKDEMSDISLVLFGSFMNGLPGRAVMGKDFRNKGLDMQFRELIGDTSPLISGFNVEEYFPFLAGFGGLSMAVRVKSERVKQRWDKLLDGLIQEHQATSSDSKVRDDFIHVLLSVRQEYGLTREHMKAILLSSINERRLGPAFRD